MKSFTYCRFISLSLALLIVAASNALAQEYVLLGWNDLGMHCANKDFSKMCVLPPFNTVHAQLILKQSGQPPQIMTSGYTVEYSIPNNSFSVGKTNFWDYAQQLFGLQNPLPPNVGLTGKGLTGVMDTSGNNFVAVGIPLTPYADSDLVHETPFQLIHLVAKVSGSGTVVASTDAVIPVSNEIGCVQSGCHTSEAAILAGHDTVAGFNPSAGPILCAACHASNALGTTGIPEAGIFSGRIHGVHASVVSAPGSITTCYKCHPGPQTQCLRDIMGKNPTNPLICQNCHGTLDTVANSVDAGRRPWLDEPKCGYCHGAKYAENTGKLYRMSTGHGGLYCEACHGSPHAIQPTVQANDNLQNLRLQGFAGALRTCSVCHSESPGAPGAHGIVDSTAGPPAPPSAPTMMAPLNAATNQLTTLTMRCLRESGVDTYALQVASDSAFTAVLFHDSVNADPWWEVGPLSPYTSYFWHVSAKNAGGSSDWSQAWTFTTGDTSYCVDVAVAAGWNLLSVPVVAPDSRKLLLCPSAVSHAFAFVGTYIVRDTLLCGLGYWLNYPADSVICMNGWMHSSDTLDVQAGWNMIGSLSFPVPASSIQSSPGGMITSSFFAYAGTYVTVDTIKPGRGYWVRVHQSGKLILSLAPLFGAADRIVIIPDGSLPPDPPGGLPATGGMETVKGFALHQNYPNPFNPTTTISFRTTEPGRVAIEIYNILGQKVATLLDDFRPPGDQRLTWDARGCPSGTYFVRLRTGQRTETRVMLLLK